jgi:2-polyprenyl-3-methyl-5-hydroxy-6-metoxy-1,4-benzoquinol methylase
MVQSFWLNKTGKHIMNTNMEFQKSNMSYVKCNLCGADNTELIFVKDGFRHVKCKNCGLVYVNPRLSDTIEHQDAIGDKFINEHEGINEAAQNDYSGKRMLRLQKEARAYLPYKTYGHILDIGCGAGGFLKAAGDIGWDCPEGIEISKNLAEHTRNFFPVHTKPIEENSFPADYFDVVRLNNVIEHLSDPKSTVSEIFRILSHRGLFTLSTPNFNSISVKACGKEWQYFGGDDHIYLFSPQTLSRMLIEQGFRILSISTKGTHFIPKHHNKNRKNIELFQDKIIKPFEKLADRIVRFTLLGHRLKMLAVKP